MIHSKPAIPAGTFALLSVILTMAGCGEEPTASSASDDNSTTVISGFNGPESVRYDPEFDIFFVSNFNGSPDGDANGFVSKVTADGRIVVLKFMVGSAETPFHGGRGMIIDGPYLWVVDAGGVHRFVRETGEHSGFVDFSTFELGFLNDIVLAGDGNLYVTDTGAAKLYRISDRTVTLAAETPISPNGITLNPENGRLILVPWEGSVEFFEWDINDQSFTSLGLAPDGGNYDGVEVHQGAVITASQADMSLHFMVNGVDRRAISLPGKPADIGIDTKRQRVAIPYVSLNRVDIISLGNGE
jgi:sugar lactone lactonase YvrE